MDSISQSRYRLIASTPRAETIPDREPAKAVRRGAVERLVAARVTVDPSAEIRTLEPRTIQSEPGRLELYRHPADKNTAATGVHAGRTLDVQA